MLSFEGKSSASAAGGEGTAKSPQGAVSSGAKTEKRTLFHLMVFVSSQDVLPIANARSLRSMSGALQDVSWPPPGARRQVVRFWIAFRLIVRAQVILNRCHRPIFKPCSEFARNATGSNVVDRMRRIHVQVHGKEIEPVIMPRKIGNHLRN